MLHYWRLRIGEAAVDLFTVQSKRGAGRQAIRVEEVFEQFFEGIAPGRGSKAEISMNLAARAFSRS